MRPDSSRWTSALRLGTYSFLILFFELALIRYLPANVRSLAYFTNLVLIATFIGMGAGLIAARHVDRLRWLVPLLAVLVLGLANWFSNVLVRVPRDPDEYLWAIFYDISPAATQIGLVPTVTLIFAACALFFVPLGALVGEEFRRFRPLVAYSVDIGGSLAGILIFGLVSLAGWPPWTWFALGFAVLALASLHRPIYAVTTAAIAALAVGTLVPSGDTADERWSPYYRINWYRSDSAYYAIDVNGSMHLSAVDFSPDARRANSSIQELWERYREPYRRAVRLDTVLVLGSGAGNDVAVLLELGARHIDAVEIDPEIARLGHELHFQDPYGDPRVHLRITDARAFLKESGTRYDAVVFGTLDSQTLLSGMSSVRLDNYVYTVESLKAARSLLAPDGVLIMYHMSNRPYIAAKIERLLTETFEAPPTVLRWDDPLLFNHVFVAGGRERPAERVASVDGLPLDATVPTDNWPYLYLSRPTLPRHYVNALAAVLAFSLLLVLAAGGRELAGGPDFPMLFLGMGFLLLETKSVTEMALLFGSTWQVNLLVFSSILLVILLANWIVYRRRGVPLLPVLVALVVSLLVGYAVPIQLLSSQAAWLEWAVGGAVVATPIFFAALVFATLFRERSNPVRSLGYNLLGAAIGGVAEYSVMLLGVKNLYLLAAVAYVLVWLTQNLRERARVPGLARIGGPAG